MEEWITSSSCHSGGCLAVHWVRACDLGNCVEAGGINGKILVRSTRGGPILTFDHQEWADFVEGCRRGEFDLDTLAH